MPSFKITPAQIRAVEELKNYGIDFDKYVARFDYQSSPTRLLNDVYRQSRQTMKNLAEMEEEETC